MTINTILSKISEWFVVPKCVACGEIMNLSNGENPNILMCDACAEKWIEGKTEICPKCRKTCDVCECIPELLEPSEFCRTEAPVWLAFYDSLDSGSGRTFNERIIYKFKRSYNRRLTRFFALEMSAKILTRIRNSNIQLSDFILTYTPRSKQSVNEYGFDHAKKLTEEISSITGIIQIPLIRRKSGTIQKNLNYTGRIKNAAGSYSVISSKASQVKGKHIILIDDVITSGATMAACIKILFAVSAETVLPAAILKVKEK